MARKGASRVNWVVGEPMAEALEQRTLLDSAPFPTLDMLANPQNTVVRFKTNLGDVDIELFDRFGPGTSSAAPRTAENFIGYVVRGAYDESFLHRSADTTVDGEERDFVVQGGGFKYDDDTGVRQVPTEPAIENEFNLDRSNVIRTLAMAKLGGNPDSATSQFFFNMQDNSENLNNQNGGFTVFAHVIQGWEVVEQIAGLETADFTDRRNPVTGALSEVPVTAEYEADRPIRERFLVTILDAEIIKAGGQEAFFINKLYFPEGFAGSTINEYLPVVNLNDSEVHYQVVVRYETGERDTVIHRGTIPANTRGGITMSRFDSPESTLVAVGRPYAIEIHSTLPVAAQLSHFDFDTATGESFTDRPGTTWAFGEGFKADGIRDFLVWQNTADAPAELRIRFFSPGAEPTTYRTTTEAFRRGGLALAEVSEVPSGPFAIVIDSDQPIVASLSHYETGEGGNGFMTLGSSGTGDREGAITIANPDDDVRTYLTMVNAANADATIRLRVRFDDGTTLPQQTFTIPAKRRGGFDLGELSDDIAGRRVTVIWTSNRSVYATAVQYEREDGFGTLYAATGARSWHFADGFMDFNRAGDDLFATIAVWNPYTQTPVDIELKFRYDDGFVLTRTFTIQQNSRLDIDLHAFEPVLDEGRNNNRFFFSVEVSSQDYVVAQMRHIDVPQGGGFTTLGLPRNGTILLTSAVFDRDPPPPDDGGDGGGDGDSGGDGTGDPGGGG